MTFVAAEIIGGPKDGETVEIPNRWTRVVFDPDGTPVNACFARDGDSCPHIHKIQNQQHVLVYTGD